MGFLDNLLKKEARKIISGVMDSVVDNVVDSAREALGQKEPDNVFVASENSYGGGAGSSFSVSSDEESCCGKPDVVEERIRKVLASDFSGMELRKGVRSENIGARGISWIYTYGVYKDGIPVAMINFLSGANDYKRKSVLLSKQACEDIRVGYAHFMLRLPNRTSYIRQQLKKIIAA